MESDDEGERVLDRCWKLGEEKVQSRMGLSTCVHSGEAEMGISSREAPDDDVVNLVVVAESEEEVLSKLALKGSVRVSLERVVGALLLLLLRAARRREGGETLGSAIGELDEGGEVRGLGELDPLLLGLGLSNGRNLSPIYQKESECA